MKTVLVLLAAITTTSTTGVKIDVEISKMRSDSGVLRCALWGAAEGFPRKIEKALVKVTAPVISNKQALCVFENVAPGTYAISVFHDENSNGEVDTNFVGMPKEPLGFSNNPKMGLGPPSFDEAKFVLDAKPLTLRINPK
jgi:uncharacterized protein (DUF2141 family)